MKTKWRPRLGSTFPRYILRSIYFLKKYSEINMLPPIPGLNFYPKMYSENKFTSPKMYSKRCKRAKAFSTLLQIFSSSAPETSDRSRGRGSSEKTENIEQFDVVHTILTILTSARDWDIPPILGADETQYLICGRTTPSEQLAEHYSADCSLTRCTIARLFKPAITHVHSQAAPNCR